MKMNKTAVYTLFLLVGISLLAHAAVSHHHPDCIPFVSLSHHHDDTQPAGECNGSHCHGSMEDCALENLYVRIDNEKHTIRPLPDFELLPCFVALLSGYEMPQMDESAGLPFRQNPCLLSCYTEFIARSSGLRAPPVSITN